MIRVCGLTVCLGGRAVLDQVSLTVKRRQITGLIGPPEAGKTVLLKCMAGLLEPKGGSIEADGRRVDALGDRELSAWQQRIGMSFQNDALFDAMTVFENVAFPLRRRGTEPEVLDRKVFAALENVGLAAAAHKLPNEISGGMRKRVGIARAAIVDPELGLFDEPVAGLDPVSAARTLELIENLTKRLEMATVIVSNDMPVLIPLCQRVVMLNEGRVAFDGQPEQLMSSDRPEVVQFVTGAEEGPL